MRSYSIPIGWLRRDPRHYRFPLPNEVWKYKFKPIEFEIFSYLCYDHARGQGKRLTPEIVAEGISLSPATAKKHLAPPIRAGQKMLCKRGKSNSQEKMDIEGTREA